MRLLKIQIVNTTHHLYMNKDATAQQAFIQKFVTENITGIRLKSEGDKQVCPACKTAYKHVSSHTN